MNPLEKLFALQRDISVPITSVRNVSVAEHPWTDIIPQRVTMGLAARTAPGRSIATIGPRATSGTGRALIVVYRNHSSVVIEVDTATGPYSLLIVSVRQPHGVAQSIKHAAAEPTARTQ
jgi:hypothetical protein